jgi:opacity protein-like surface antigen
MKRSLAAILGALTLLSGPAVAAAQVAPVPQATAGPAAYGPFERMIGRSWRGTGTAGAGVEDIQRWD